MVTLKRPSSDAQLNSKLPNQVAIGHQAIWLDAFDPNADGSQPPDNTAVSAWKNKFFMGLNTAAQGTGSRQPRFRNNILNGTLPAVRFDGTDTLAIPDATVLDCVEGISFFCVASTNLANNNAIVVNKRTGTTGYQFSLIDGVGTDIGLQLCSNSLGCVYTGIRPTINKVYLYEAFLDGARVRQLRSGALQLNTTSAALPIDVAGTPVNIASDRGATNFFNGDIYELIIYNIGIAEHERVQLENYLKTKWGLEWNI